MRLALDKKWGVFYTVRTALVKEQVGTDTDTFINEGHGDERVLPAAFLSL